DCTEIGRPKCLQSSRPFSGLRSRRHPAHHPGCSAPLATGSCAISPAAPPLQACARPTTTPCGTSASCAPRSKRRSTALSPGPTRQGCHDGLPGHDGPTPGRTPARGDGGGGLVQLTVATILVAFAGVFLIGFMRGAFGGGFAIIGIPLLSTVMDPVTAGGLLAPLFIAMDLFALRYWKPSTWSKPDLVLLLPGLVVGIGFGYLLFRFLDHR